MLSDLRFALRQLGKSPGFTLVALLTLALGIGLNAAMFNIVNSIVLQPLKFPHPESLFRLNKTNAQGDVNGHRPANYVEIARGSRDVAQVACSRQWSFTLSEPGRPAEVLASLRASAGYFRVLDVPMELGREFLPEEDAPGRDREVILSHAFWRAHFSGDPGIVGKTMRIDGQPNEIIGVAPAIADDPRTLTSQEIYRPLALTPDDLINREDHAFDIIGRYRPGVSAAQAASRFDAIQAGLVKSDPKENQGFILRAVSLVPQLRGTGRQIVYMLIGLSGFVLLIACANLANLLLARALARSREFAIRGALGASRAQLIRPLVVECGLLALAGGVLGVLVSAWTDDWMAAQFNAGGSNMDFPMDWRFLLFACGASLATGLIFGAAPAWITSRVKVNDALKSGTRGATGDRSQNRFRQVLIAGQFALALVLLSGAVFFVRGLDQLLSRDGGWNPAPMLRGILSMPSGHYPDAARQMRFYEKVQERVSGLPGVAAVSISHEVPAFYFPSDRGFIVKGQPPPAADKISFVPINGVTPGYFNTVGTRLTRGRDFTRADRIDSPPVIIISETMARVFFPGKDAIGQYVAYFDEQPAVWRQIVGVAQDVRFMNFSGDSAPFQAYLPQSQATWSYVALLVRASVPPSSLIEPIRKAVAELDPDMAVKELAPVPEYIERNMRQMQAINQLLVGFALLGLFLAALGIYGVITHIVAQRTNEIGIRMALGARVGQIARLILGSGVRLIVIGTFLGLLGSVGLARFLASAMPGIAGNSFVDIAGAVAVLIAVALLACWLPTRRATQVNPLDALRAE